MKQEKKTGFLNGITDIFHHSVFAVKHCPVHCRMLSIIPGLSSPDASNGIQLSLDVAKCPKGEKIALSEEPLF